MNDVSGLLEGRKILYAEDSPEMQKLFQHQMKTSGAEIVIASNGQEAVDQFSSQEFDIVILDINMPVMDGYEAAATMSRMCSEQNLRIPILGSTAHAGRDGEKKCLDSGFSEVVSKGLRVPDLIEKIAALCKKNPPNSKSETNKEH